MEQRIDQSTWKRKEIFDFFSGVSNPFYMVTFRQDVTALYHYTKRQNISFYYALIYLCTKALDQVEAFRYVIRGGEVYRLEGRSPSFTDLAPGSEQFHIVTMPLEGSLETFCAAAKARSRNQRCFLDHSAESDGLIYYSCLPWVDLTALTNERDLQCPGARDESIPHIAWGKYVQEGEQVTLGISVEVNHRLIDGLHIGLFAQKLTELIQALGPSAE